MVSHRSTLVYGNMPVPYTVLWSAEDILTLGRCRYAEGRTAVCNGSDAGNGKPVFGKPHMQRQREAVSLGLCDLCGKALNGRTKVSLSHASERIGANGLCVMQVEPLLHKECAAISMRYCPSLKSDIRNGTLFVRQVNRYRVQLALLTTAACEEFTGETATGAVGHAKIELLSWKSRDAQWLGGGDANA